MNERTLYKSEEARRKLLDAYEGALARWEEATGCALERRRVASSAGETTVFSWGPSGGEAASSVPLLLIHGTLSNSASWMGDAASLARKRRVYAIDIPGEPGLSEERSMAWEPKEVAAWVAEIVAALGLGPHALAGMSLGGWISLAYAIGDPAGLEKVALLCPAGMGRMKSSFFIKAIIQGMRGEKGLEAISRSLFGRLEPPEGALEVSTLFAESTNPRMESPRIYTDEELRRIEAPILLVVGERDVMLRSLESARRLARLQPRAKIHILPRAGHALVGQGALIAEFLDT
jgi:pimeloyl-ACP methyl ester carboxylesterase